MKSLLKTINLIDQADVEGVSARPVLDGVYRRPLVAELKATMIIDLSGASVMRQRMAFLEGCMLNQAGLLSRIGFVEKSSSGSFHEIDFSEVMSTRRVWHPRASFDRDSFLNDLPESDVVILVADYETFNIDPVSFQAWREYLQRAWGRDSAPCLVVRSYESKVLFEESSPGFVRFGGDDPSHLQRYLCRASKTLD